MNLVVRNVWGASKSAYLASFNTVLATCMQPLALEDLLNRDEIGDGILKRTIAG